MISVRRLLHTAQSGRIPRPDLKGNTLLHNLSLAGIEHDIPLDIVENLIQSAPHLLTTQNKEGLIPAQLLEAHQHHLHSANRPLRRLLTNPLPDSPLKESLRRMTDITLTEYLPAHLNEGIDFKVLPTQISSTLFQKPTFLCFSGRGTFDPALMTGFMRKIRASLNITDIPLKNAQMLCARYPGHMIDLSSDWQLMRKPLAQQFIPDHPSLYVKAFVHRYLRPLYLTSQGEKLPPRRAMKNMRLLNFYGYSYGTAVIQLIADELSADMKKHGYTEAESALIQSQILTFQMGSDLNPEHYHNYFRQYHLLNTQDEIVFDRVRPLLPTLPQNAPDLVQTHLKESPNQTVLLVNTTYLNNDDTPHHTNTYCNESTEVQKRVKLWKNSILFNGLNNSVQNAQSTRFIPLARGIEEPPKRLLFTKTQEPLRLLTHHQKLICRAQKIVPQSILNKRTHQRG